MMPLQKDEMFLIGTICLILFCFCCVCKSIVPCRGRNSLFLPSHQMDTSESNNVTNHLKKVSKKDLDGDDSGYNGPDCVICLETFDESDFLVMLPCKHAFHKQCIQEWFKFRFTCPLCNQQFITPASPEREYIDENENEYDNY